MCAKSLQWCLTLCDSMDCSPPGSSVHGILQARIVVLVQGIFLTQGSNPSLLGLPEMAGGFLFLFFFYHQRCLGSPVMPYVLIPSTWISELVAWSAWHPRWRHVLPLDSCFLVSMIADGCAIQETWVWSLGREDPLEKGMAIHSLQYSCLENPWAEKSGGLQSMGLQGVRHDWETNTLTHGFKEGQSSAQFSCSVVSNTLRPMDCSMPSLPVHHQLLEFTQTLCSLTWWCHPTISFSVIPFSSRFQSFPASGSFPPSQFFTPGCQSTGVSASASALQMSIQDRFPLGWAGWISLQSKETLKSLLEHHSSKSINSLMLSLLYSPILMSIHEYWKNHIFD